MKNNKLEIEDLKELSSQQKQEISGGSEFSDWTWDNIGAGAHHLWNFFTKNPNMHEHIW